MFSGLLSLRASCTAPPVWQSGGAVVKEEALPPAMPVGAVVKEEEGPPEWPVGAVVKEELLEFAT